MSITSALYQCANDDTIANFLRNTERFFFFLYFNERNKEEVCFTCQWCLLKGWWLDVFLYNVMLKAHVFFFLLHCHYYWDYFKTFIRCFRAFSVLYFFFFSFSSLLGFLYRWVLFGRSVIQKREINCYVPSFFSPLSLTLSSCRVFPAFCLSFLLLDTHM